MSFLIGGFPAQEYRDCLNAPSQPMNEVKLNFWFMHLNIQLHSEFLVLINRIAYCLLHGFAIYPNNAYLFQKFKSHEFHEIDAEEKLRDVKEILEIFQQCLDIDQAEVNKLKDELNEIEELLITNDASDLESEISNKTEEDEKIGENSKLDTWMNADKLYDHDKSLPHHISYCEKPEVIGFIDSDTYKKGVQQLPIACVDIFLYDPRSDAYLYVYRKNAPAKDTWWMPGGRLFKGESFFEAAERKCWDEIKVKVTPLAQLGTYATIFPDSEWGCQTHTINTVVLAILAANSTPEVNKDHEDYEWRPLKNAPTPEDPYLTQAYQESLIFLESRNSLEVIP